MSQQFNVLSSSGRVRRQRKSCNDKCATVYKVFITMFFLFLLLLQNPCASKYLFRLISIANSSICTFYTTIDFLFILKLANLPLHTFFSHPSCYNNMHLRQCLTFVTMLQCRFICFQSRLFIFIVKCSAVARRNMFTACCESIERIINSNVLLRKNYFSVIETVNAAAAAVTVLTCLLTITTAEVWKCNASK